MPKVLVTLALFGSVLFAASASFADQASAQTSNIVFTAPTNLTIPAGRTGYIIYAAGFARDGSNTFTCGAPTAVDSTRITVAQNAANSCFFTVNASATAPTGNATFTTLLTSSGGDTHSATFTIAITAASDITFTAPASIPIGTGRSKIIDVSGYATDGDYAITCSFNANPANRHRLLASVTATGCSFRVWAGSTQGAATVTVRYHSSGGDEQTGVIPLIIGPSSVLIYQRVSNLRVRTGGTITIDAGSYAHDRGGYPVLCDDATAVDSKITVNSRNGCVYNITAGNTTGRTSFSVPYTSASGSARTDRIDITIVASHIVYTAPASLSVGIYSTIRINAADYASDGSDTISCGTIRQSHALIANIRSHAPIDSINDAGCSISITAGGTAGIATFTVPYTSSGGDTHSGVVSLTIGTASSITLASNPQFLIRRDRVITIDAARYATDGDYDITCTSHRFSGAAAAFTLKVSRNGCIIKFQSGPSYSSRDLNLAVGYSSSGGATASVNIAIGAKLTDNINGAINFTPPIALAVAPSRSITIDASSYATLADSDLALFCLDARRIDSKITVTRKGCSYTIRAGSSVGVVAFTVPYISSGGYTTGGMISIRISPPPPSVLVFSEPDEFQLATNRTLTINGRDYASDGGYRISCRTTTDVDSKISLRRRNCVFTVTPTGAQGIASFTLPYTSAGGGSTSGVFTIEIGPASTISYTAPTGLKLATNRTLALNASDYASDGNYHITCGNAISVDSKITVARPNPKTCDFSITPTGATGTAAFTVPYTSSGGHTQNGVISIEIGAASTIVFTAPSGLSMTAGGTMTINAASYATDGAYDITCANAADRDAKITRITNTGCSYKITAGDAAGTAAFTIPYTSSGGHALRGQVSITISARPQTSAPASDRQNMICSMLGFAPLRHSTADSITEADKSVAFCRSSAGIVCLKGNRQAKIASALENTIGTDASINSCHKGIT